MVADNQAEVANQLITYHTKEGIQTMSYNGWTNYETWLVNLWADEYGMQNIIQDLWDNTTMNNIDDVIRFRHEIETVVRDWFGDLVVDQAPSAGFVTDCVNSVLGETNWTEIANAIFDNLEA